MFCAELVPAKRLLSDAYSFGCWWVGAPALVQLQARGLEQNPPPPTLSDQTVPPEVCTSLPRLVSPFIGDVLLVGILRTCFAHVGCYKWQESPDAGWHIAWVW